ncbi:hypothetical protein RJI07_08215 [Mycoplasmatota bacterium WC30]
MNTSYKRAVIVSSMFGTLFVFMSVYFIIVGPTEYLSNKIHFLINSIVLAISMLGFAITMILTQNKENVVDERDYYVQKKSYGTGMILSLMYVFLLCIIVFIINRDAGTVPVTWLWFIGYSTFAFAYAITSLVVIINYNRE